MTPHDVLDYIAGQSRAVLPVEKVAEGLAAKSGSPVDPAELEGHLAALVGCGDIHRWVKKGTPVVTLSSVAAYRFRLRLNPASTRWVEHGSDDEPDRNKVRKVKTAGGDTVKVLCESEMAEEPPGKLDNIVDERTHVEDDPGFGRGRILAEENKLGLKRPTLPLVGIRPWTAGNWERAPDAHVCDPLDDPRRVAEPGDGKRKRRMTPEKLRAVRPAPEDCPVCNGRELREMIGLSPMKIGKNRAARPPELVIGGEFCCRCSRSYQDSIWPRVFKITDNDVNGKVAH